MLGNMAYDRGQLVPATPGPRRSSAGPTSACPDSAHRASLLAAPAHVLALQRAAGNRAATVAVARQEAPAVSAPTISDAPSTGAAAPPQSLLNGQLVDELRRLERGGSTAVDVAERDKRFQALVAERAQRIRAGHIWLADGGTGELLTLTGDEVSASVEVVASDPRQAGATTSTPIFTRAQLNRVLAQRGVVEVELESLRGTSTGPAAGAVPGPAMAPQLLGGFYPFQRALTESERLMVAQRGALHYTAAGNLPSILVGDGNVRLDPSTGYRNVADPAGRQSTYFFAGEPSPATLRTNTLGAGAAGRAAVIVVQGADLPSGTVFRPVDSVLAVPGGYRGPAQVVAPGASLPAAGGLSPESVGSASTSPASMADQLRQQGSFSGHPLATTVGAGVIAMVTESGLVLIRTGELPSAQQMAGAGVSGSMGGAVGAVSEQAAARTIAGTALGQSASRIFVVIGRGGAGAIGGTLAAPVVEMGRMAMDDQTYTGTDYVARGTRAAVAGLGSGALAAGATAALAGSVAPGVGTAVGFVVGVGAYLLIDWLAGDAVESGVRSTLR